MKKYPNALYHRSPKTWKNSYTADISSTSRVVFSSERVTITACRSVPGYGADVAGDAGEAGADAGGGCGRRPVWSNRSSSDAAPGPRRTVPTAYEMWSYEHACRAYEELDALSLLDTSALPRAIEAEGWTYDKDKRAMRRGRRWYSFMELMRIELRRERVGSTYMMSWLTNAPVSTRKRPRIREDDGSDDGENEVT